MQLGWDDVAGAAGYLVERAEEGSPPVIVQHGGSDVPAIATHDFADTGLTDGVEYTYRVAAVAGADAPTWNWSTAVSAGTRMGRADRLSIRVDAASVTGEVQRVWAMVGSERLTQLRFGDDGHGHDIGQEFTEALRRARDDLGVTHVRAHAILHDDNAVVSRADDGTLHHDFGIVDDLYDRVLALGLRPIVELSFMPAALARDPNETVFAYRGIISPPRDWIEWRDLVAALAQHLVDRYGLEEVRQWGFEVWNEANLVVFWTGTKQDYLRLYAESAKAVKSVDTGLRVGGPSTAAGEWIEALAAYCEEEHLPLDFATSHTYGNLPIDSRPSLRRHGFDHTPIWWTEWGVGSTHCGPTHDAVAGAPFMLSGYAVVQGRMDALAYWVISDHFEELGRPPRLFHDGFGLLTVGNLGSRAIGRRTLLRTWATTCSTPNWTATEPAFSCRRGPRVTTTAQSTYSCGTGRSTPTWYTVIPVSTATSRSRSRTFRTARTSRRWHGSIVTIRTSSSGCPTGRTGPTNSRWPPSAPMTISTPKRSVT